MKLKKKFLYMAVVMVMVLPILFLAGNALALYLPDGSKEVDTGVYSNPEDGVCVAGLKFDGTLDVVKTINNYKDCIVYTTSTIKAQDSKTKCEGGTGNSDGYKHAWSTSICVNNAVDKNPISRVDLDNTAAMCASKGGVVYTGGLCVAYGWQYMNVKPGESIPYRFTINPAGYKGRASADQLGFCYATMRMTTAYGTPLTCPSINNFGKYCAAGANAGLACYTNTDCPSSTCFRNTTTWPDCGSNPNVTTTNTAGCQTQTAYDEGLGWAWDTTNNRCNYSYGVKGYLNSALTNAAGATATVPLCAGGTGAAAANTCVNLTGYATMGDCLAVGGSWDNWLPYGNGSGANGNASTVNIATTTSASSIVKLDAITPVKNDGGKYYSGTGSVCLKCHSDQSRSYMERYKPGFVETPHKKAADTLGPWTSHFTAATSDWGLNGVQCTMCHSTARPANDDLIQVTPAGVVGPPAAGTPIAATGHNKTEYGSYVTDVCFHCHGKFDSSNPANNAATPAYQISVSSGDFALTPKGLAPIANQFLNSPHAQYWGTTSNKVDIGLKTNYASGFVGYECRTAATTVTPSAPSGVTWNQVNCTAAGYSWATLSGANSPSCNFTQTTCENAGHSWAQPGTATSFACYYNSSSCSADQGIWNITFDTNQFTAANGGVCSGVGIGSIVTTVYRSGAVQKIPNLDSTINTACTNFGNGTGTSGASGFWVRGGERNTGAVPRTSDQGSCMTCHDVHWDFDSTNPQAEPIRRECTTCHANPGTSASGAPQIVIAGINHPTGEGTPLAEIDIPEKSFEACEICHMPFSSDTGSRMHLWRINTSSAYQTMGTTKANYSPDDAYTNAAWVDLSRACGQCHKPSGPAFAFTTAQLSGAAIGMHSGGSTTNSDCLSCHALGTGGAPVITPGVNHHGLQSGNQPFNCTECHVNGHNGPLPDTSNDTCMGCHAVTQSGPTQDHHAGSCVYCHHTDGSFSGAPAAGVIIGQTTNCNMCHATVPKSLIQHPTKPNDIPSSCQNCHQHGGFMPTFASACNQCHGGSAGPAAAVAPAPYLTAAKLSTAAATMHKNVAPKAAMKFIPTVTQVKVNVATLRVQDKSTDVNGDLATIIVAWGDGKSTTIPPGATTSAHTYTTTGTKTITLTAIDSRGLKATATAKITVIK